MKTKQLTKLFIDFFESEKTSGFSGPFGQDNNLLSLRW